MVFVFFCKQKTAYEMRISDWSSDVCSSDLLGSVFSGRERQQLARDALPDFLKRQRWFGAKGETVHSMDIGELASLGDGAYRVSTVDVATTRSEEHTSELQSLMRISYAVFCLKKTKKKPRTNGTTQGIRNNIRT